MEEVHPLWVARWAPQTVQSCILPKTLKATFQKFVDQRTIPNLLLTGKAGVGKTSVAKAMMNELGAEYVMFNGSLNVDKDTLRNEISDYCGACSFNGERKYVIIDEADYLNPVHVQPALRNFMTEYSDNVGFIFTCNYKNKIIDPLHSRCSVVEFVFPKAEIKDIATQQLDRACGILVEVGVQFDRAAVGALVAKFFPDFRRVLNELQRYSASGKIDTGILVDVSTPVLELIKYLKGKNFTAARKWVSQNTDIDAIELFRALYEAASAHVDPKSIPLLVIILSKYQYQHAFAADSLINTIACLVEIMAEVTFK